MYITETLHTKHWTLEQYTTLHKAVSLRSEGGAPYPVVNLSKVHTQYTGNQSIDMGAID